MTSTRSYRPARSIEEGIAELRRSAGTHFDPELVEAFIAAIGRHGWTQPDPVPPPDNDVETTQQDHDDPSAPLRVASAGVSAQAGRPRPAWQSLDSAQLLLIAVAGMLVIASVTQVGAVGLEDSRTAILFGGLIAIGELLRMLMRGNREVAAIDCAGGIG